MLNNPSRKNTPLNYTHEEVEYDDLVANLLILLTQHSLTNNQTTVADIVDHLHHLSQHPEIELYPNQRKVMLKMSHLWRTRLFNLEAKSRQH